MSAGRYTETLTWRTDPADLPDDEQTVLLCSQYGVGEAFREAGVWYWASASRVYGEVHAWAEMPTGEGWRAVLRAKRKAREAQPSTGRGA